MSTNFHSLPGPDDILRSELPNGITVLSRANFNSPSVVISGFLMAGSLFEPDALLGLADFTSLALMRGTQKRDFQAIYNSLESVGASMGFSGGTHSTGFSGKALAEDLPMLLELLAETLRYPSFPIEPIERLRAQFLTGLAMRTEDTAEMASLLFDQLAYEGHPYSRAEEGWPETVQAIRREDLVNFHSQNFGPRGMVVVVVGGVEPHQAAELVSQTLGDWENPNQPAEPVLPPLRAMEKESLRKVTLPGKSQADIVMGAPGPSRESPEFLAASLGNSVLGQFGMYGRIGDVVREQSGLAYYAYSGLSGGYGPGPWMVSAGVNPANVNRAIELIKTELVRFTQEPVSQEELADSQANFIGRLPLSMESNAGVAAALTNLERHRLGLDYYRRYPGLISAITPEEILEAAQRYLHPDRLAIAVAGP